MNKNYIIIRRILICLICFFIFLYFIYKKINKGKDKNNVNFVVFTNNSDICKNIAGKYILCKNKDKNKYFIWKNMNKPNIKVFYVSINYINKINRKLLWSWVFYDKQNKKIICYSHTKESLTPYDNRNVWNLQNINIIKLN